MIWLFAICVLGVPVGFLLLWRIPLCGRSRADSMLPVSIIIPARNEERNLTQLLASISKSDYRPQEVIVVDDCSSDETAFVANHLGATVVTSGPLPYGWTGKTWACSQGAETAGSELVLFLDADTYFVPGGLEQLVVAYDKLSRTEVALSLLPYHVMCAPYEQLSLIFNLLMAFGAGGFGMLGGERLFGQSLLISRDLYVKSGGHAAVRHNILENFALSSRIKDAGGTCVCLGGFGVLNIRMFPDGLAQLCEGWSKAFADGAAASDRRVLMLAILWLTLMCSTFLLIPLAPAGWHVAYALLYLCYVLQLVSSTRQIGNYSVVTCILYPLPLVFFFAIFAQSLYRRVFKRKVTWRGRSV